MAFSEDTKAEFFRLSDFADTWTVAGNSVLGIFENEFVEDLDVEGETPKLLLANEDAAGVEAGDPAVGPEGTYEVIGIEPDGTGVTTLRLKEQ